MSHDRLVILAGGISSRMKERAGNAQALDPEPPQQAHGSSKAMLRFGSDKRPFLDYLLMNAKEAGYREVVIVTSEKDKSFREYYRSEARGAELLELEISFARQGIPAGREKPLGTADALLQALRSRPNWQGDGFTVCNSDNLYSVRALNLLRQGPHTNAMIDYDRSGLQFPPERIAAFAVTKTEEDGFLIDIIEKPTPEQIAEVTKPDGRVGVSMNVWKLAYEMIFPFLEAVPLHPVRQEKELPRAIFMLLQRHAQSVYAYPLCEHVPDLTSQDDLPVVRDYLGKNFGD